MIDIDFRVYLIEVNTNPALSVPCPLLTRILSNLLDSTFRFAVDPIFPPPPPDATVAKKSGMNDFLTEIKFELVFDEKIDGPDLRKLLSEQEERGSNFDIGEEEEEEEYEEGEGEGEEASQRFDDIK
jgi:hypothetical protein